MSKIIEEKKDYKYDAFISYRHNDLDKFVAENLHKMLETYVLPKNVREELNLDRKGIKRVFRDQEELPLSSNLEDPIVDALENSKYLIIICSPRLKDSMWCKKEIQTFKKLRGRKNMFCVLVEGEPSDSFPEEVLFEEKTVIDEKGKKHTEKINIEPLAADVRGENKKEIYNKLKSEKLRLIAPMFNIDYDKLRQRHHERKVKRVITISILVVIFCILFTLYSSYMLIKISNQRKMLAENQAVNLAKEASKYYEKDNIEKSIKNAYSALTTYKGVKMPYTSKAAYELTLASGIYDAGNSYKVNKNYITKGIVDNIKISNNKKYLVSYDESETLTIWNLKNDKKIIELGNIDGVGFNENSYTIINDKMLAYINKDNHVVVVNLKDGSKVTTIKDVNAYYISGSSANNLLIINELENVIYYDIDKQNKVGEYKAKDERINKNMYFSPSGEEIIIFTSKNSYDVAKNESLTMHVINSKTFKELNNYNINAPYIKSIKLTDKKLYLLSNSSEDILNPNTHIYSYNYKEGKELWSKTYKNSWGNLINISEEYKNVIFFDNASAYVLDDKDGSEKMQYALGNKAIGSLIYTDYNYYLAILNNGEVHTINVENNKDIVVLGLYDLKLKNYTNVLYGDKAFYLTAENENRIIKYASSANKDIKEVDYKADNIKTSIIIDKEKKEYAKKYNIDKKNLIKNILFDDDKKTMFVFYTDNTLCIYNTKTKEKLSTITDIKYQTAYLGKDKKGNMFLTNLAEGYIIDKNYEKIALVKNLVGLNAKKEKMIVSGNSSKHYEVPIYTLDEIKSYAKKLIK